MYAVLYVANFYLQAVLRSDPSLTPPRNAGVPPTDPGRAGACRRATSENNGPHTPGLQHELMLVAEAEHGMPASGSPTDDPTAAVNGASFSLPRGTGSAHGASGGADIPSADPGRAGARRRAAKAEHGVPAHRQAQGSQTNGSPTSHGFSPPPLAIVSGDTKKSLLLQANSLALAAGVEIGMTAPQAQARCAFIVLRQRSTSAEADAQQLLLACALDVAPLVENTAPGVCTIDVSGLPAEDRSRHVARAVCHLREQGLATTAGLAATPLLALYASHQTTSVRTVENATAFLHPLPLSVAEPPPALVPVLQSWGISTLGQFTALPKQEVVRRLGTDGHALWERARGGEPRPLHPHVRTREFAAALELEYEVETAEGVLFILRRFVDRLAFELRAAGLVAAELFLLLKLADETAHERSFRLPEPTAREDVLFRTLHTYLESLRTDSAVTGVALRVSPVRPLVRQPGLFETGLRDPHGFSETLARVTAIVGSGQLGTPELEDTHRPDAVKLVPPLPVVPALQQPPIWPPLGLPLRRYRPPQQAHVELTSNGQPAFLSGANLHSPIGACRGPWRSSGDWWKPEGWSREEWDVELAIGGLYRIARVKDEWYLDGEYE